MGKLKSLSAKFGLILLLYGGWGLFVMSFLDSSFVPFPALNDIGLIVLSSQHPARWPLYAFASTFGSVCGTYVLFFVARAGGTFFWKNTKSHAIDNAHRWLERNEFAAILVASLLPPPAPLKVFILAAGVLRVNPLRFGLALLLGRGIRFCAEAWLGATYGVQAEDYVRHNIGRVSLGLVVVIVGFALLQRWLTRRPANETGV
jgi:membrane protein YqaA with SNARE-associated domain